MGSLCTCRVGGAPDVETRCSHTGRPDLFALVCLISTLYVGGQAVLTGDQVSFGLALLFAYLRTPEGRNLARRLPAALLSAAPTRGVQGADRPGA